MGNSGMQCQIRDRGMGNESVDKRLNFFLIENYDTCMGMLDDMESSKKNALLTALDIEEDDARQGSFRIEAALAQVDND